MSLKRTCAIVLRYLYLMRGSPARVLPLFIWVAIDIVLWGFITRYLNAVTSAPLNFIPVLLGAVLFWDFFGRVMQGVTMTFFEDVWSRNFLNVFASPLWITEYVSGLVLSSIVTSAVALVVMFALATLAFGWSVLNYGLMVVPFLFLLFLFGIALGIIGSALVLRLGPAAEWFVWPIPALLSPFAGVFYPISVLPAWMQYLSKLLPPSYVFEAMRAVLAGQPVPAAALFAGGGLSILYILLACRFFTRVFRHAVQTGLISRYSAETVT